MTPCAFLGPWVRALPISSALRGCPRKGSCASLVLGASGASPPFGGSSDPCLWCGPARRAGPGHPPVYRRRCG
eukprot:12055705-Heterocapsa_arctica.AAC.1